MSTNPSTCQTCKWWREDDGTCHRYPPETNPGTWGNYWWLVKSVSTDWPETSADDFCGEHEPRNT